jgi:hypothetical protein
MFQRTNTRFPRTLQVELSSDDFKQLEEQLKLPDPTAFLDSLNLNPHSKPYYTVRVVVVVALPETDLCAKRRVGRT